MTEHDIKRMESALQLRLPVFYRRFVGSYPIRHYAGRSQGTVWDSADDLIERNVKLHNGEWGRLPQNLFFVGTDNSSANYVIDVTREDSHVLWIERTDLRTLGPEGRIESLEDLAELDKENLIENGVDPNRPWSPDDDRITWRQILWSFSWLIALVVLGLLLIAFVFIRALVR